MNQHRRNRFILLCGFVGVTLLGGVIAPLSAGAARPSPKPKPSHSPQPSPSPSPSPSPTPTPTPEAWTTRVNTITRDSLGNPAQASFTITGLATPYAICLKLPDVSANRPDYNTKAATYDTYTYLTYKPCVKFAWSSNSSNTQTLGTHFTFGGPGTYEVHWYVPDVGGIEVGTPGTLNWANSTGTWSPCPWDPQLQIGVWRPSRHQIINRCRTLTGTTGSSASLSSLDKDRNWSITTSGGTKYHAEYMLRDTGMPSPPAASTWTITGIQVCDLYHGYQEIHAIFRATNSSGTTYLTGPQYSTATPSVSGTWTLKSCA